MGELPATETKNMTENTINTINYAKQQAHRPNADIMLH